MASLLGIGVIVGLNVLSWALSKKPDTRNAVRKERFELPRTEEGEHIPVVIGIGELAPNFVWSGNVKRKIIDTESGPRTLYYANAIGSLCHGPLTKLIDVLWEDLHLSAAPPTTNRRPRGEPVPVGPALSVPLPFNFNGGYLDEMIYSLQWFGGIRTVDGQGGIAGRMHVHSGQIDQLPCEMIFPWWGEPWVPGWPDIAYVVFGGVPFRCPPNSEEFSNLMQPFKWSADGNPSDGIAAGGGGAAPIQNGELQCFGFTEPNPPNQEMAPHLRAECGVASDAFGFHVVPPGGGARLGGGVTALCTCQNLVIPAPAGSLVFANTWQVCAGCTQGYNHAAHKITCLRPGDKLRVRGNWIRTKTYNYRTPNPYIPGGNSNNGGGGITLGSSKTVVRPDYNIGWAFGHTFDDYQHPLTYAGTVSGSFDWTSGSIPQAHEDDFGNVCYLGIGYGAGFRMPWSEVWITDLELTVLPGGDDTLSFNYVPDEFTEEGRFYWGTNPRPLPPRFLVSCIPIGVSGAGVGAGANLVDAIYETIVNKTWGLGRNPLAPIGVDMANFQVAATQVEKEKLGVSAVWDTHAPAGDRLLDLCTAGNAILYQDRETGMWKIALVRPDYDVSLLLNITPNNSDDFVCTVPAAFRLVAQVHVRYRRWKQSVPGEVFTNIEIGEPPYAPGVAYQLPGAHFSDVQLTQDGSPIDVDDYTISSEGLLRFSYRADSIDWDGPEPVLFSAVAHERRAGFEDAVATATNDALWQALGNTPPLTLDMPMLMDSASAQRAAEDALLTNSRPLRDMRWKMKRVDPRIHPGSVVKVTRPEYNLNNLPVRVLKVSERPDPDGAFYVEGVEEKYGFRTDALIFHPFPDRPPLDFPGDVPGSLGQAPLPAGLQQIVPSDVRLAVYSGGDGFLYEIARTRVNSFYVGDPGEFGPDGCSAAEAPVFFTAPADAAFFDDPTAPDDGCPVYYWIRHIRPGYQPSGWLGPILAVIDVGTPADELDPVAPFISVEEFEDITTMLGHSVVWIKDPQLRIRSVSYELRLPGQGWQNAVTPPRGNGLFEGTDFLNEDGWGHYSATVDLPTDLTTAIDVRWTVTYRWSDGIVVEQFTTTFPLYLEPVWDDNGALVLDDTGETVYESKLYDITFNPTGASSFIRVIAP